MDLERGIYSQGKGEGEQGALLKYFGEEYQGAFLDIGAWTGYEFSNTRKLVELGWRGVMVEASPYCFNILRENLDEYSDKVHFLNVAICPEDNHPGFLRFHETADAVSTSSDENMEVWKDTKHHNEFKAGKFRKIYTGTASYLQICEAFGFSWDFVNIDTEGSSVPIMMDILKHARGEFPKVICVEHDGRAVEICGIARDHGYGGILYQDGNNLIVAR